jgi:tetratricopeptide (TPR) repeat protein
MDRALVRASSRVLGLTALGVLLLVTGCGGARAGGRGAAAGDAALGTVTPRPVDDAGFGGGAYRVLMGADSGLERASLLAGVVARQLERAKARFEADEPESGLLALQGAFLLMRRGEFRREGLTQAGKVLSAGAAESARRGEEGYALALYSLLDGMLPQGPERDDVRTHLAAMAAFSTPSASVGPLVASGSIARVAAQRALLDSSDERFAEASGRMLGWVARAHASGAPELAIRSNAERDEALEAYRALRGGGYALVALYLRHSDPLGAVTVTDEAGLDRVISPELRARLEAAADDDDADAWVDLYRFYDSASREAQAALSIDPELFRTATFGVATSLFRAEPGSFRGAMPLATRLVDFGMAEVAPLVLNSGLQRGATPDQVAAALALTLNAMVGESQVGQHEAARRTFAGAAPLLELAGSKAFAGRVSPSPARLRYVMGALEADFGELARAEELLRASLKDEPLIDTLKILAAILRQRNDRPGALGLLERARQLAERTNNALEEAESWRSTFEVLRDSGDREGMSRALEAALSRALDATKQSRPGAAQARAERVLAHVLEHFGERAATRRATQRAYDASSVDSSQLSATVIDAARRALTSRDLQGARAAVAQAVEASLPAEDLVYVALWLELLELELSVPSDGSVESAFSAMDDASGWSNKLRAWGRGKLGDGELLAGARSAAQRTEATFYTAMARRVRGDVSADAELEKVSKSPAVNLVEVGIARDLLSQRTGAGAGLKVPPNVALP